MRTTDDSETLEWRRRKTEFLASEELVAMSFHRQEAAGHEREDIRSRIRKNYLEREKILYLENHGIEQNRLKMALAIVQVNRIGNQSNRSEAALAHVARGG